MTIPITADAVARQSCTSSYRANCATQATICGSQLDGVNASRCAKQVNRAR